jgi:hypothetical protein
MPKFQVTFKSPDGVSDSIQTAALGLAGSRGMMSHSDYFDVVEDYAQELRDASSKWIRCEEYVTIEFDSDAGTATVLESK